MPKRPKQPPKLVYDRKAKRWRRGGRYARAPDVSELRVSRSGFFIDGAGKRVSLTARVIYGSSFRSRDDLISLSKIISEIRSQVPEKKEKPSLQRLSTGKPFIDGVLNSSNWNKKPPEDVSQIFEKILERASKRSPFEIHDILIYQNGLKFLGHRKLTKEEMQELADFAFKANVSIKYADTNAGTEVYLFLGKEMKLADDVSKLLERKNKLIQKLYDTLIDYWGSLDWWYWFETEESLYE